MVRHLSQAGLRPTGAGWKPRPTIWRRSRPLDLILADWRLPQFSGLRALASAWARLGLDIPFVIVSGSIGEEAAD